MAIVLNGDTGITTPDVDSSADISVNGVTVGKGTGSVTYNTALGDTALAGSNSGDGQNTGLGWGALNKNTTGAYNTAVGTSAMFQTTTGSSNVAIGRNAVYNTTSGSSNTGVGVSALQNNTTASNNTAVGYQAGYNNTTGTNVAAFGYLAAYSNTTGQITAIGRNAGYANTTGAGSTYIGDSAGSSTTGGSNTFVGNDAGNAVTTGANNTIIGRFSGNYGGLDIRTASNCIVLSDGDGNPRLIIDGTNSSPAYAKIPYVYDRTTGSGANVTVSAGGILERSTSSLKYKREVQDATHGLAEVLHLRPITYKGKSEKDGETIFGGLIAEEVHDAGLTEFVQYAEDGTPDALAYGNMVSLCIKAIQELNAKVEAQAAEIAALKGQ